MDIDKRNRAELKSYFVKNSIPTESNFAELIDGMLNLKEDGVVKLPDTPLSIETVAGGTGEKKALHIYESIDDAQPAWMITLDPLLDTGENATGLSISDGEGGSHLIIERNSGNVGIGTNSPAAKLHIAKSGGAADMVTQRTDGKFMQIKAGGLRGTIGFDSTGDFRIGPIATVGDTPGGSLVLTMDADGNVGVGTTGPVFKLSIEGDESTNHGGAAGISLKNSATGGGEWYLRAGAEGTKTPAGGFSIADSSTYRLTIDSTGNVGIGLLTPIAKLDIGQGKRTNTHPAAVNGLYITGDFGQDADGIEFRRNNGKQGIGFGYNTIYATGSNANQDLGLKARGDGLLKLTGALQLNGVRASFCKVVSQGWGGHPGADSGIWLDGKLVRAGVRSYSLVVIQRSDHSVVLSKSYDIFKNAAEAITLAADLAAYDADYIVIIQTHDEPRGNSVTLLAEITRAGGSASFSSLLYRGAYLLIGIPNIGAGNGIEMLSDVGGQANAWVATGFWLIDGMVHGLNG